MAKKLLLVTFEKPNSSQGGLGTYVQQTINQANAVGLDLAVLCLDEKAPYAGSEQVFGKVRMLNFNPIDLPVFKYMGKWGAVSHAFSDKIVDLFKEEGGFDVVEFCDGFGIGYFTPTRKLAGEKPFKDLKVLITAHTPISLINQWSFQSRYRLPNYWTGEMERFCLKAADLVISPSQYLVEKMKTDWDFERADIAVVRNPYEAASDDVLLPAGDTTTAETKQAHYLSASRVHHFKGIPELVAGFDRYWRSGGKNGLHIYGGDTYSELHGVSLTTHLATRYKKHIESGALQFLGQVDHEVLQGKRQEARALLHPSLHDNFPYSVLEHMGKGGVVAASQSGGHAEIIGHRNNGFLFDASNPGNIEACLHELDTLSAADAKFIGSRAQAKVEQECNYQKTWQHKLEALERHLEPRRQYPFIRGEARVMARADDEKAGLLSVVIPHFNLGNYLKETVESALASTYQNLEVIIVDDGSTDPESIKMLVTLEKSDARIKVIRKENSGVAETRNVGAAAATGEYIALLDADDLITPDYYECCVSVLSTYPNVGYVGCWNEDFDESGTLRLWPTFNPGPPAQFIFNTTNCQGIVVRRQAFLQFGQHDRSLNMFLDDWECTIALLANDVRGVMLSSPKFRYRIRGNSIFRSKQGLWHLNYEKILKKHQGLVEKYAVDALLFLNQNGPNTNYHNPTYPSAMTAAPHQRPRKYKSAARQALSDIARAIKSTYRNTY